MLSNILNKIFDLNLNQERHQMFEFGSGMTSDV